LPLALKCKKFIILPDLIPVHSIIKLFEAQLMFMYQPIDLVVDLFLIRS